MRRIHEIDLLRGIAVICMIIFHLAFDLNFFGIYSIPINGFFWTAFARIIQIIFIVSAGITCALSSNQARQIKHAGYLFLMSFGITFVTWIFFGDSSVKFGILHFFAVSILLAIPFKKIGLGNILIGGIILVGSFFMPKETTIEWIFPIGLITPAFKSLDFFPLIPWFGLFLQGVALGAYIKKKNLLVNYRPFLVESKTLEKIGRHSLIIYIFHQPVLIFGLYLIFLL